jgi:hypothetical protein
MIQCHVRVMRFGRQIYPSQAAGWIFPADSDTGHLAEQKEDRATLSKWGSDLRQSFRTIATAAGVSEFDAKLLMNHTIPGVNSGYITRHKLLEVHLSAQQQQISSAALSALGNAVAERQELQNWLGRGSARRMSPDAEFDHNDAARLDARADEIEFPGRLTLGETAVRDSASHFVPNR